MADDNIRLIYASTATVGDGRIESPTTQREVFAIVGRSRANNLGWGVVGVLCYGDGAFLQVLEGRESAVDDLFAVISADERHRALQVLRRETIEAPLFARWSMKFPTMDENLREVLGLDLYRRFDPRTLETAQLDALIHALQQADEGE